MSPVEDTLIASDAFGHTYKPPTAASAGTDFIDRIVVNGFVYAIATSVLANLQAKGVTTRTMTRKTSVADEGRSRRDDSCVHLHAIDSSDIARYPVIAASAPGESVVPVSKRTTTSGEPAPLDLGSAEAHASTNVSESDRQRLTGARPFGLRQNPFRIRFLAGRGPLKRPRHRTKNAIFY
jgi:hypothetical protein